MSDTTDAIKTQANEKGFTNVANFATNIFEQTGNSIDDTFRANGFREALPSSIRKAYSERKSVLAPLIAPEISERASDTFGKKGYQALANQLMVSPYSKNPNVVQRKAFTMAKDLTDKYGKLLADQATVKTMSQGHKQAINAETARAFSSFVPSGEGQRVLAQTVATGGALAGGIATEDPGQGALIGGGIFALSSPAVQRQILKGLFQTKDATQSAVVNTVRATAGRIGGEITSQTAYENLVANPLYHQQLIRTIMSNPETASEIMQALKPADRDF